ncbi:MAG: hypothetical protein A2499_01105 [Stygiobacter sp. RIFOXYC12_FULL_38_8]|nr:MAG: hypothetical protein A2279_04505 [Stygiobacter sp. RIFOXYA12_FULL_38_9]OGV06140.1 MAG: hypothetical protein A2299_08025 [Stygiobacter sp. RIFOXYB2_FULL_37_11]OGV11379.1 MAG: hypothetical protein A2237_10760 [Stygiobacter sp. RIFOXYA2_FULL_38_8]OGV16795.1 MAG: hypothetical protein A2440_05490 [Stygiobacter sp. RIFOXYC2_FULL_38_25]OGV29416.1 MAG: hypothetical protein A2499_01105 [Stygiobacter sp. RIFOXYC12_FULL_38_8]OGV82854.1 MAG: hypothetical protein A2X65_12665 [Stygiobacter sp. GWF2_
MNQDTFVYMIILATISYIGFSFFRNLRLKRVSSGCGSCTGCELSKNSSCNSKMNFDTQQ